MLDETDELVAENMVYSRHGVPVTSERRLVQKLGEFDEESIGASGSAARDHLGTACHCTLDS